MSDEPSTLRFSTTALPEHERLPMFREVFGRGIANMDITPLGDTCWAEIEVRALPRATIMWGANSPHRFEMLCDPSLGSDELALLWAASPTMRQAKMLRHVGKEAILDNGMAVLTSCADRLSAVCAANPRHTTIRLDRARLRPLLSDPDDALMRPISTSSGALRLLKSYVHSIRKEPHHDAALQHMVVTHICDLIALAIGTTKDATEVAAGRGLRAARLDAAKTLVLTRMGDQTFSIRDVALAQGVTPRYIQRLFEEDGTTFSAFLLGRRLGFVHRRLHDPVSAGSPIGLLAFEAGFGDLSYFNRVFRNAFGETPSDVRHRTLRDGPLLGN